MVDDGVLDFWSRTIRLQWLDALTLEAKALVTKWWTTNTTRSLNQKKVHNLKLGVKKVMEHPAHFLQMSQVHNSSCLMFSLKLYLPLDCLKNCHLQIQRFYVICFTLLKYIVQVYCAKLPCTLFHDLIP
jgi:hypothetical protein